LSAAELVEGELLFVLLEVVLMDQVHGLAILLGGEA
jgi:hypothetical protein